MRALATRQQDLSETIALLPGTLEATDTALGPLQASFAPTQQFAAEILPGVKQTGPTIAAGLPWLAQAPSARLQGRPRRSADVPDAGGPGHGHDGRLAQAAASGSGQLAVCFTHTIIPTGNERISDPPLTTGLQDYQELFQSAVGIASAHAGFRRQRPLRPLDHGRRFDAGPDRRSPRSTDRSTATRCWRRSASGRRSPARPRRSTARRRAASSLRPISTPRRRGPDREARDPHHRRDFIAIIVLVVGRGLRRRLHPRAPAGVHVRPELLHDRRRVLRGVGGDVGTGAAGRRSPACRSARSARSRCGRQGGRADEHRQEVRHRSTATRPCCCDRAHR